MLGQASFSDLEYANKKRRTRRETFLAEMDAVVPWQELLGVVEPHYPRAGGRGRPPVGLASMLRIYFLQQWFALSDRQMEDGLYDIESMRRFAGFSNVTAALPDETTILNFRHLLEQHDLTPRLLAAVNGLQNAKGERDPEMHQTKKGNQWYFGMKIHIGADVDSGAVHSVSVTAANRADISELPNLLRENDQVVFGDAGYASDEYKRGARALGMVWRVQDKAKPKSLPRRRPGAASGRCFPAARRNATGEIRPSGRASSICSASSSGSSATPRCATAGWRRTPPR